MSKISLTFHDLDAATASALIAFANGAGVNASAPAAGGIPASPPPGIPASAPPASLPPASPPPGIPANPTPPAASAPHIPASAPVPAAAPVATAPSSTPAGNGGDIDAQLSAAMQPFVAKHKLAGVKALLGQLNIDAVPKANYEQKVWLLQQFQAGA